MSCEPSALRHDSKKDVLARSSRRHPQPFHLGHCCGEDNRECLPGPLCNSGQKGAMRSVQAARWARNRDYSKSLNLAPNSNASEYSSIDQPSRSTRGSEMELTTSARYSSFQNQERSLDPGFTGFLDNLCFSPQLTSTFSLGVWLKARKGIARLSPP